MRLLRMLLTSLTLGLIATRCWAHGAEELGHHWEVPAYRNEMQTQILMMIGVAAAVLATLWLVKAVKTRRLGR